MLKSIMWICLIMNILMLLLFMPEWIDHNYITQDRGLKSLRCNQIVDSRIMYICILSYSLGIWRQIDDC